jgi:uncharacterized surface protein with fasciclin (FAS1) repeats
MLLVPMESGHTAYGNALTQHGCACNILGKVLAADIAGMDRVSTAQGGTVSIEMQRNGLKISDATIIKTDILASNGVIQAIDDVIVPN